MGYAAKQNLPKTEVTLSLEPVIREVLRRKNKQPNQNKTKHNKKHSVIKHEAILRERKKCSVQHARRNSIQA